jgi:hypothetical protein
VRRLAVGLTLVFVFLAAGCGGGGSTPKEEFQKQANAICKRYDQKIAALGAPSSPADIPQFVEKGIPLIEQGVAELRALKQPQELEADYELMLDETEKAVPAARKLADAAAKNDAAAVQEALTEANTANQKSNRLATKLGLSECATN